MDLVSKIYNGFCLIMTMVLSAHHQIVYKQDKYYTKYRDEDEESTAGAVVVVVLVVRVGVDTPENSKGGYIYIKIKTDLREG
jgi:hypothetical protein